MAGDLFRGGSLLLFLFQYRGGGSDKGHSTRAKGRTASLLGGGIGLGGKGSLVGDVTLGSGGCGGIRLGGSRYGRLGGSLGVAFVGGGQGADREQIRTFAECYYALDFTLDEIRPTYRFNETCQDIVPQAMEAFLESASFEDCIRCGVSVGGDTDTLCAICGGVAEAYYGMTDEQTEAALSRLDAPLRDVAEAFRRRYRQDA